MTPPDSTGRRTFLKTAGVLAVGTAAAGASACDVRDPQTRSSGTDAEPLERRRGFDRAMLDAIAVAMLPESLGTAGIRAATDRFVAWADGYEPVAEEMHGYGYADIRYLPADPSPAWRAQLTALDLLARKTTGLSFTSLPLARQRDVLSAALRSERAERLPSPLAARHIAMALLGHWAASPEAWDLALGVRVTPGTCRTLDAATRKPLPLAGGSTA
jgi:hypothetical protein